jgi:RimJ/RimL family protein N-acetyltransferase
MDFYFNLVNEPEVRANSFHRELITRAEHEKWFSDRLNSPASVLLVLEVNGIFAGQIRFDRDGRNCIWVDYSMSASYRGKGLGKILLSGGVKYYCQLASECSSITAKVKMTNIPSIRAFLASGFTEISRLADDYRLFEYRCPIPPTT